MSPKPRCGNLSDCYWIKPRGEDIEWKDVNLFTNDFVDTFGEITLNKDNLLDLRKKTKFNCAASQGELQKKWCIDTSGRMVYIFTLVGIAMPKFKIMQSLVDKVNLVSREILTGLSVIRAFGREKEEEKRFDEANRELTRTQLFTNRVMTFMMPGMSMIMYCITLGIVWVAAGRIDNGSMQVGTMTAFITYAMMIVMSFLMLSAMSIMLPRAGVAAERIDEVIKTNSTVNDPKEPVTEADHRGVIRFNHVDFRYPGAKEDVLSDIDFVAEPGKTTAIIGSTT